MYCAEYKYSSGAIVFFIYNLLEHTPANFSHGVLWGNDQTKAFARSTPLKRVCSMILVKVTGIFELIKFTYFYDITIAWW